MPGANVLILLAALLSGLCTPVGAWGVLTWGEISGRGLAAVLGLAAGVMVVVVLRDLLPAAWQAGGPALAGWGGAVGFGVVLGIRALWGHRPSRHLDPARGRLVRTGWLIALVIALHDIPEGMAIGAGHLVRQGLGWSLALAMAVHNVPEGMSIAAPLARGGIRRGRILLATLAIGLVTPAGTAMALALGAESLFLRAAMLALAAGAMTAVTALDIVPEAFLADAGSAVTGLLAGGLAMWFLAGHG